VVANYGNQSLTTFERLASGDSTPKRAISSPEMYLPQGIAIDLVNDELLVANSRFDTPNAGSILTFGRTDSGNLPPRRTLGGNGTQLCNPISVALDVAVNEIVVANSNFAPLGTCAQSVTTYDRTAAGNTAPKRMIAGPLTALNYPI